MLPRPTAEFGHSQMNVWSAGFEKEIVCAALPTVMSTVAVVLLKFASAALVAVTVQAPTPVPVKVVPLIVQTDAPAVTA